MNQMLALAVACPQYDFKGYFGIRRPKLLDQANKVENTRALDMDTSETGNENGLVRTDGKANPP